MSCMSDRSQIISIRKRSDSITRGANGEEILSYSTVVSNIRAKVVPLKGGTFYENRQQLSTLAIEVTIAYRTGVNTGMQIVWRGAPYAINEMIPQGANLKEELLLRCEGFSQDA